MRRLVPSIAVACMLALAMQLSTPVGAANNGNNDGKGKQKGNDSARAQDPGVREGDPAAGEPLPGLTGGQLYYFEQGKSAFEETAFVANPPAGGDAGLGPGFNGDSCVGCHSFPATGGGSPAVNPLVAMATANGGRNKLPWFVKQDGPALEVRFKYNGDRSRDGGVHNLFVISGRADAGTCGMLQEDFSRRDNLSFRQPTPLFGLGLVEAIPESILHGNLISNEAQKAALGIHGKLNINQNDGSSTRFGWKAQNKSLAIFAGEAYNVEMGVTNLLFPQERNETAGCTDNPLSEDSFDLETGDADDVILFSVFMRFLAPPERGPIDDSVERGSALFEQAGCALCHTPSLNSGLHGVAALNNKQVPLYSDLALHAMGPELEDDIEQGIAEGDEFRTAPLWGLGQRIFLLHDGRTKDLMEAIQAHTSDNPGRGRRSEADGVIRRFNRLSTEQQQDVLNFLRSL